jgi:hypothetical protein
MATCRCRRELPDLGAGAAGLPQQGEHRPGTRAVGLAARDAPLAVSAVESPLLTPWGPRPGRPGLRRGQPPRAAPSAPATVCQPRARRRRRPRIVQRSR